MKVLDSDLLSFMSALVDIKDPQLLIGRFIEGLNSFFPETHLSLSKNVGKSPHETIELKAFNEIYGFLVFSASHQSQIEQIRQLVKLFHPVLENLHSEGSTTTILPSKNQSSDRPDFDYLLQNVYEKNTDAIYLLNEKAEIIYVNTAACKLLGYTENELLQLTFQNVDGNYSNEAFINYWKNRDREEFVLLNTHHIAKDGRNIPVEVNSSYFSYRGERYYFGIARDISERIKSEEALKESESKYRFLTESSLELICLHAPDGTYQYLSPSIYSLLGYKPEELIGKNPYDLFHPDHRQRIREESHRLALEGEIVRGIEYLIRHKDGHYIWFDTSTELIKNEEGELKNLISRSRDITEKKLSEQQLKRSEEKYRLLFENMNVAFALHKVIVDDKDKPIDYTFIEVNPVFEKLTGLKSENVQGKNVLKVLPKTERYWIEQFGNVALTGIPLEFTNYAQEFDKYYETKSYAPQPGYFAVTFHDVTERIKVEQALKASEEKYKFLAENTSDMVIMHRLDGSFTYISPVIERMTGYTAEEYKQFSPFENIYPDDKKIVEKCLEDLLKSDEDYIRIEYRIYKKNGEIIWIESRSKGLKDAQGNTEYFLTSSNDITERKNAEEALAQSEELFRNIFEYAAIGIAYISTDGKFLKINGKFEDITGYSPQDLEDMNFQQITHPEDLHIEQQYLQKVRNGELDNYSMEKRYIRKNGEIIWINLNSAVLRDRNHNVIYAVAAINDITDRKRFEEQLELKNREIAIQNIEYQATNEELKASNKIILEMNKKLEKANQELDSFVYRVSHDLRAPITSSLGLSELLHISEDMQDVKKYASLQKDSLSRLDRFIKDILNYSRNTRLEVVPEVINFSECVENALQENHYLLENSAIQIIKNIQNHSEFKTDRLRIEIILKNLISNAIKFINPYQEEHFICIDIVADSKLARIEVQDNGIGIDPKHQERIFEMFYRATDKSPGSGIGLYILKDCLQKINGEIELKSEIGQGTNFKLLIPTSK